MTVLFADVAGSTALGESLDPEDLRALLGRYYGIARDVVYTLIWNSLVGLAFTVLSMCSGLLK